MIIQNAAKDESKALYRASQMYALRVTQSIQVPAFSAHCVAHLQGINLGVLAGKRHNRGWWVAKDIQLGYFGGDRIGNPASGKDNFLTRFHITTEYR